VSRPRRILLSSPIGETELRDIDQLALRAWVALLSRTDIQPADAAGRAYQAAESMLDAMHRSAGE